MASDHHELRSKYHRALELKYVSLQYDMYSFVALKSTLNNMACILYPYVLCINFHDFKFDN